MHLDSKQIILCIRKPCISESDTSSTKSCLFGNYELLGGRHESQ